MVAVLRELKSRDQDVDIRFWCDRKFGPQAKSIVTSFDKTIPVEMIFSGKLRRYHNLPLWRQLLRPVSIVLPNLRDAFFVVCGLFQSLVKLMMWRPDVVFTKGGFVCLPVGLAAKILKIPLVIHDSDAHPGLTNRILAKWSTAIATGAPLKYYPYPKSITRYIGIPIDKSFMPIDAAARAKKKALMGFDGSKPLIVITGGGLGARRINDAVAMRLDDMLQICSVLLISGTSQYDALRAVTPHDDKRFQLYAFVSEGMSDMLGAADIVVARAGATTILELVALARPTILIPNGFLTAGHQLKNAAVYAENGAVEVIDEEELVAAPQLLVDTINALLVNKTRLEEMSKKIHQFNKPDAASEMADMIVGAVKKP